MKTRIDFLLCVSGKMKSGDILEINGCYVEVTACCEDRHAWIFMGKVIEGKGGPWASGKVPKEGLVLARKH